jgi:hypothetical protein
VEEERDPLKTIKAIRYLLEKLGSRWRTTGGSPQGTSQMT